MSPPLIGDVDTDAVLAYLAHHPRSSAREIAADLGIPAQHRRVYSLLKHAEADGVARGHWSSPPGCWLWWRGGETARAEARASYDPAEAHYEEHPEINIFGIRHFVYRLRDSERTIVYVGYTGGMHPAGRLTQHRHQARTWWREVATVDWAEFGDEFRAQEEEARQIHHWHPVGNTRCVMCEEARRRTPRRKVKRAGHDGALSVRTTGTGAIQGGVTETQLLTVAEVAARLGVSPRQLQVNYRQWGIVPTFVGRYLRFAEADVDRYLTRRGPALSVAARSYITNQTAARR